MNHKDVEPDVAEPLPEASADLICEHLSFSFGARKTSTTLALRFIPGEKVLIKGENGSGKSTLLSLIAVCTSRIRVKSCMAGGT